MLRRVLPFVPSEPLSLWKKIHPHPRHGFFLGSGAGTEHDHLLAFSAGEPSQIFTSVADVEKYLHHQKSKSDLPRLVGLFGFEAGRLFDNGLARLPKKPHPLKTPDVFFGDYPSVVKIDLKKMETTIAAENKNELQRIVALVSSDERREGYFGSVPRFSSHFTGTSFPPACMDLMRRDGYSAVATREASERRTNNRLSEQGPGQIAEPEYPSGRTSGFTHMSVKEFSRRVLKAKQAISRGDIYQANLSIRFERSFHGDPLALYQLLCESNPSPYASLLKMDSCWIVSSSPELLLSVKRDKLTTRPIAGTRPRGTTLSKDAQLKGQLLLSSKERAEHIMLVDLERNDLGRVSVPGSVRVTERFAIERYSHVMHIVSEVEGRLQKGLSALDSVKGLFPGGTITGCPKISAVQTIENLEGEARGPFYGSLGYFCGNGDAMFNILIRTALIQNKKVYVQAGAGIVADSHPAREYRESLTKAQVLLESISRVNSSAYKSGIM